MKNIARCFAFLIIFLAPLLHADEDVEKLVSTCAACHGAKGISPNDQWPNLAGQQVDYLVNEMKAFRDGKRIDPLMSINLKGFSDDQLLSVAKHYANLPVVKQSPESVNLAGRNVRARCVSCHGMTGNTVTSEWPNLAGQKVGYLQKQLMGFKSGTRKGPVMEVIAKELTDEQIASVAEYFSQI